MGFDKVSRVLFIYKTQENGDVVIHFCQKCPFAGRLSREAIVFYPT